MSATPGETTKQGGNRLTTLVGKVKQGGIGATTPGGCTMQG